jgi:hypothetical protein
MCVCLQDVFKRIIYVVLHRCCFSFAQFLGMSYLLLFWDLIVRWILHFSTVDILKIISIKVFQLILTCKFFSASSKSTGWFRLENTGNLRKMEAVFWDRYLTIFTVTYSQLPVLSHRKQPEIDGKIRRQEVQNTVSMFRSFRMDSGAFLASFRPFPVKSAHFRRPESSTLGSKSLYFPAEIAFKLKL